MKKIIISLIAVAVFVTAGVLPVSAQKIDSSNANTAKAISDIQNQISAILKQIEVLRAAPALQDTAKVASPQEPPQEPKMPPVSETTAPTPPTPGTSEKIPPPPPRKPETPESGSWAGNCMQKAVTTRDTSIINAAGFYSKLVISALETRRSELVYAWGLTDKEARNKARHEAWKKFFETKQNSRGSYLKEVKAVWDSFRRDRIDCKEPATGEDPESDNQL